MTWGPLGGDFEDAKAGYFTGASSQAVVGLGGSVRHLIGAQVPPTRSIEWPVSGVTAVLQLLREEIALENDRRMWTVAVPKPHYLAEWVSFVRAVERQTSGTPTEVEFLARTHLVWNSVDHEREVQAQRGYTLEEYYEYVLGYSAEEANELGRRENGLTVLLGTPIYVAVPD